MKQQRGAAMDQINNMLVTLSFDTAEQAEINHALTLATLYQSKITFLSVIPKFSSDEQLQISAMSPQQRLDKLILERKQALEVLVQQHQGFDISTHVACGRPSDIIIEYAIQHQHDLIIISSRPQKTLKEKLFGSTSNAVLRRSPVPVLAVQPEHVAKYNRIMVSVDISQEADIINNKVISEALSLAESDNSELHALSVIPSKMPAQDGEDPKKEAKQILKALIQTHSANIQANHLHIGTGDAAVVMYEKVKTHNIDLLVMGMASRKGLRGFFIGNLAERIISTVNCSILIVKPDGFKG
jgi:universal stress protein E